jgi:hypothetical protein
MKIIKKGKLTIDGEQSKISGYEFDCEGESMLNASIYILEEGVRDLLDQIAKAKAEGINIFDAGGNQLNDEKWEFPLGVKAHPAGDDSPNVRWFDNYSDPSLEIGHDSSVLLPPTDVHSDQ